MTDQSTLFDQNRQEEPNKTTASSTDDKSVNNQHQVDYNAVFADQLNSIQNEAGEAKYKNVTDALMALKASQDYIKTLERENSEYKSIVTKDDAVQTLLSQLKNNTSNNGNPSDQKKDSLDIETIQQIVNNAISTREVVATARTNQSKVSSKLVEQYGEKAREIYESKARELGLPVSEFDRLAGISPNAVLNYFNSQPKDNLSSTKNVTSSTNTASLSNVQPTREKKSVMYGASTADMVNAWREAGRAIE